MMYKYGIFYGMFVWCCSGVVTLGCSPQEPHGASPWVDTRIQPAEWTAEEQDKGVWMALGSHSDSRLYASDIAA